MAATEGVINGTKIGIYAAGTKVAYATSASISSNQSLRDTTTKDSGAWRGQAEGLRDWEASVEGMVIFTDDASGSGIAGLTVDEVFATYMTTRTKFTLKFSTAETGDFEWSGDAYLTSLSMDAPTEDSSTWSASFGGTGELTKATI